MMDAFISLLAGMSSVFLAYYLAALGHAIVEKSGVLNLAIDGVFVLSIAVAYAEAVYTNNNILASLLLTAIVAALFGMLLAFLVTKFPISHGAVGLSMMFLGYGLASLVGLPARNLQGSIKGLEIGYTIDINNPAWIAVYIIIILIGLGALFFINKTKIGAAIRAAGEDPAAAEALGVNVLAIRLFAGALGFALIGLGGAIFELAYVQVWSEGTGMGHGWLAFAISLSAGRHPLLLILSSSIFAGLVKYMTAIQAMYNIPTELAKMLPFIAAILAMVIFMATPLRRRLAPPKSLGKIYFREERTV